MNDDKRTREALMRLSILGDLVHRELSRGELKQLLKEKSQRLWRAPDGSEWAVRAKTLQKWYYDYKRDGIDGLMRESRIDKGSCKAITPELQQLILDMKREDPGRSVPMILRELQTASRIRENQFSASTVQRLLKRHGLSGPQMELERRARYRWQAPIAGALWQGDCCHGPKLMDPSSGQEVRARIFALIDDKTRLVTHIQAFFHENQESFLTLLLSCVLRRGAPRAILLDNHGSFTGSDVRLACARLAVALVFARPYDGAGKGKIERFWRTLRAEVLDRLDLEKVLTLDDLNLRMQVWLEGKYNRSPHSALGGKTPLEAWELDADEIRWIEDDSLLEGAFTAHLDRKARNDSTCQVRGRIYEVPSHMRGRRVRINYCLLKPEVLWIQDGDSQVMLREVDPVANSGRPRAVRKERPEPTVQTGLNHVEDLLRSKLRPGDAEEEGTVHA